MAYPITETAQFWPQGIQLGVQSLVKTAKAQLKMGASFHKGTFATSSGALLPILSCARRLGKLGFVVKCG